MKRYHCRWLGHNQQTIDDSLSKISADERIVSVVTIGATALAILENQERGWLPDEGSLPEWRRILLDSAKKRQNELAASRMLKRPKE